VSLLRRLTATLSAKANDLLDRLDNPGEALDYAYQLLIEQLGTARQAVTRLELAEQHLAVESARLEDYAPGLETQARKAVSEGRDDLAREALARRSVIKTGAMSLARERDQIAEEDDRFTDAVGHLEDMLAVLAAKKEAHKASYAATGAKAEIDKAVAQTRDDVSKVGVVVARAEARAAQLRSQVERIRALLASGALLDLASSPESIRTELDVARRSEDVARELVAIKRG
jgi:phage shock protein A